jgi:hypothetical protein
MQLQRNNDEPVWINIANLPETVVTADLQVSQKSDFQTVLWKVP